MKFHDLLNYREELMRQAKLANIAYAYQWLGDFARRIADSELRGAVVLRGPNPDENRLVAKLEAQDISQAVVEEHFLDAEVAELHAVLAFVHDASLIVELSFRLEELGSRYLPALREVLEVAEVLPEETPSRVEESGADAA